MPPPETAAAASLLTNSLRRFLTGTITGCARSARGLYFLNNRKYSPYPSSSSFSTGMNRMEAEFMQ